jgi:hypothetical protein
VLEFVEEEKGGKIQEIRLVFDKKMEEEMERFKKLVIAVYKKISSLDLELDIAQYDKSLDGIRDFEDDLIAGRI